MPNSSDLLQARLARATPSELLELAKALELKGSCSADKLEQAFYRAGRSPLQKALQLFKKARNSYRNALIEVAVQLEKGNWYCRLFVSSRKVLQELDEAQLEARIIRKARQLFEESIARLSSAERVQYSQDIAAVTATLCGSGWLERIQAGGATTGMGLSWALINSSVKVGLLPFMAATRVMPLFVGGSLLGAVSLTLLPILLSRPSYRKMISSTILLILIGERIKVEDSFDTV